VPPAPYPTRLAPHGMVCAVDHLAAGAGVEMLRRGGNAVDAAVATNAVTAVTSQHQCGMGGDLFALVHRPGETAPATLSAAGRAGSGADPERLRAEGHTSMPPTGDIRSVPVPGCVDGWVALHERYGRLPLAAVLAPAQGYAADGFPVTPEVAAAAAHVAGVPGGDDYRDVALGGRVRRPGVARALAAVAAHGRDGFYGGEFGTGLLALGNGEFTEDDLARNQAEWVEPLAVDAWGHRVWTVAPPSQGYLTLAGAWIADGLPLPDDPDDPAWAHLLVEAARQAAYDRLDVLHEGADGRALVAEGRLGPRRAAVDPERAASLGGVFAAGDTTYLCVVDGDGMGVSLIQSNAGGFGSLVVEPNTRIFLQNRGIGFSLQPDHPAEYGPRRRPPHTLSPALVTRAGGGGGGGADGSDGGGGELAAVLGTMGGDGQPQVVLQLLARLLHAGQSPGRAVASPRWVLRSAALGATGGFDTWSARGAVCVQVEGHAPAAWFDGLAARGHAVERLPAFTHGVGHAHVIVVGEGTVAGAADPRAPTAAAEGW
jgi:gamma-glutamyltranspeptidase/glutathione hydrolase